MFVEHRTYTLQPGKVKEYLDHYERDGLQIQKRHLPKMVGYYSSEVGVLNQIIHMWRYESYEERDKARNAMRSDSEWAPYWAKVQPLICHQESKFLNPAPFFDV